MDATLEATPTEEAKPTDDRPELPPLLADPAFWGMTLCGFLGAMNDNLFQQFLAMDSIAKAKVAAAPGAATSDGQWLLTLLLGIPFVLFSGFAGILSDRYSKRTIVIWTKVAEAAIMLLGVLAWFFAPKMGVAPVLACLFLMGVHSTFFGPAKYGILPEMLRESELAQATGITLMATFLAIILGTILGPSIKQWCGDDLVLAQSSCVLVALLGIGATLLLRPTPPAQPDATFELRDWAVPNETLELLFKDRELLIGVLASCLFWFSGMIIKNALNSVALIEFQLSQTAAGYLGGALAIGICVGSVVAGSIEGRISGRMLVTGGAWGIVLLLVALMCVGYWSTPIDEAVKKIDPALLKGKTEDERFKITQQQLSPEAKEAQATAFVASAGCLFVLGLATGVFIVPIQVFLQARPPAEQKGRMIGAQAFFNWVAISASALVYLGMESAVNALAWDRGVVYGLTACCVLPIALLYQLPEELHRDKGTALAMH